MSLKNIKSTFISPKGREILSNNESFSVPKLEVFETVEDQSHSNRKRSTFNDSVTPPKKKICTSTRAGKGTHGLRVVKTLLEDEENWKHISKDDYQYLGVFPNEQMQVAYYCEDCTKLDQNCSTDPHFLWHDIQMSKGKVNKDYSIFVELGGVKEELIYRCAPCNGVKVCSQSECKFVAPISHAEILGLGLAVGKNLATNLLRGCKVHWARSWRRVRVHC